MPVSFSWDRLAAPVTDDQGDDWVCGRCMRDQHDRCTERDCKCCAGMPQE